RCCCGQRRRQRPDADGAPLLRRHLRLPSVAPVAVGLVLTSALGLRARAGRRRVPPLVGGPAAAAPAAAGPARARPAAAGPTGSAPARAGPARAGPAAAVPRPAAPAAAGGFGGGHGLRVEGVAHDVL